MAEMAYRCARLQGAAAIVVFTASGASARLVARYRPPVPIYAFTQSAFVARKLSVRETEVLVKKIEAGPPDDKKVEKKPDVHTRAAEDKLRLALGTRVRINRKGKGGRIEIDFVDEDELQRLYETLTGE